LIAYRERTPDTGISTEGNTMRSTSRLFAVALGAALLLGHASTVATAGRLSTSTTTLRVAWGPIFAHRFGTVICEGLTLSGSFHSRTLAKVRGTLIGNVSAATARPVPCTAGGSGSASLLTERLPWHVAYDSFTGTLPNISGVKLQILGFAVGIRINLIGTCLYRSEGLNPLIVIAELERGATRTWRADEATELPWIAGPVGCPNELSVSGREPAAAEAPRWTLI
jgi:hypothetical protein